MNRKNFFKQIGLAIAALLFPKIIFSIPCEKSVSHKSAMDIRKEDIEILKKRRASFDDQDFRKNVRFAAIPILEPIINSIVEELNARNKKL